MAAKGCAFVNCDMAGFIALDEILRLLLPALVLNVSLVPVLLISSPSFVADPAEVRCVVCLAFEPHVRDNPLQNYAADAACLRVPFHAVTAFERLSHPPDSNVTESYR